MHDEPVPDQPRDGWPELTYRYVEHYYWEPQHLRPGVQEVDKGLRRQEVPLNYFLNVLLRLLPASYRRAVLEPFVVDPGLDALIQRTPPERDYVEADVYLESAASRVFIEVKVDAPLRLKQVGKYVRLHEDLNEAEGFKRPTCCCSSEATHSD
jgi:hypothetical protein